MSWSGGVFTRSNGSYSGTNVWASDEAGGFDIESARHDTHDQDLATGINSCVHKGGQNTATANLPMGGFKHTGAGNASATGEYLNYGQILQTTWTPTLSGFSANPTNSVYRYQLIGKTCTLFVQQGTAGTSNSTSFSISLPFTAATVSGMVWGAVPFSTTDNSVVQTTPAQASIVSAGTTVILAKSISGAGGAWTSSGGKAASFTITYETA